ncbi:hypothetical protein KUTeg_013290 [Tegillarca granosa]|uniref:TTF-type domain-containing protein n=1 Tax=Tegillarca granosa TaxID=220873 RepID=A0ABQ9EVP4_TEGGR|nr:hypothetical protein KUTeg_013290 [Tegillarca granosa]
MKKRKIDYPKLDSFFQPKAPKFNQKLNQPENVERTELPTTSSVAEVSPSTSYCPSDLPHLAKDQSPSAPSNISKAFQYIDPVEYKPGKLDDRQRRLLLCSKREIKTTFQYPKNNQGRRFNKEWENQFEWLRYSESTDGAYCAYCIAFHFDPESHDREFVSKGFTDWKNAQGEKRGALRCHENSEKHKISRYKSTEFLLCTEESKPNIKEYLSSAYKEKIEGNRAALLSIIDIVLALAKRNIPFRGNWIKEKQAEDGNFNFFINWKANHDNDLQKHLTNASPRAKYLSPTTQNELIVCCEAEIQQNIKSRMLNASFFSVMADETTDESKLSQLSICVRYVDWTAKTPEVAEDFIGFIEVQRTDAETITTAIIDTLQGKWSLDTDKLRGQGYDGCSSMSGEISGVKQRIKERYPKASILFTVDRIN